ncbi:DUF2785 domain-containing protein [Paenibacillus xylanilyticus]|uniref:DUF2785 domain-containing protein n=1 Tax=Paenibacillus xylanilyticus TaxID=248903 RepID=A0A7Y6EVW4_9BACL|nr:DUF2785 domain-containing protein [Paenibacillus xylanilyticus]NUU76103.1 DUF2785 domain-containing protein [Paenibacillus xylanilyticus]
MDATSLKEQLLIIHSTNLSVDAIEQPYELALHMMEHIGSTDPVLRDELIYVTFATWIGQGIFSKEQLRLLLYKAMDDQHLFYGVGEQGTDSVFTRAFSVLLLPPILNADRKEPFLTNKDIEAIHYRLTTYLKSEKDVRGYVEGKGWTHTPAHASDAVEDLAQSPYLDAAALLDLLDSLAVKIMESGTVYIHDEDQRIAYAVVTILRRNQLNRHDIASWVDLLGQAADQTQERTYVVNSLMRMNVRVFLQTLYLAIRREEMDPFPTVRELVLNVLEKSEH